MRLVRLFIVELARFIARTMKRVLNRVGEEAPVCRSLVLEFQGLSSSCRGFLKKYRSLRYNYWDD